MLYAIAVTLLAIVMTYPGIPLVFSISAVAAYAGGRASRANGGSGLIPVVISLAALVAYVVALIFVWMGAISAWFGLGL
jgi:hypothetical protein